MRAVLCRVLLFAGVLCPLQSAAGQEPVAAARQAASKPADLVFRNGGVYTVDAARTWAEAVAVDRGRIVYVGSNSGAAVWIGAQTAVVDLQGKMLLPGFHDAHVHLSGGVKLGECPLDELETEAQILAAVKRYADQNPDKTWIRGSGWSLPIFRNANPHKSLLDKVVPDRPVVLSAADGHSIWVNSRALEIAGVTKETPDPAQGRIERDPNTREPTGTIREESMTLVTSHMPRRTTEEYVDGLRRSLKLANRFGITSVQEASVDEPLLKAFALLDQRGELTVRVVAALEVDPPKHTAQVPKLVEMRNRYRGRRLRATAVKIFADGVIESHTAALLAPYLNSGDERGRMSMEPDEFKPLAAALDGAGFQIHIHAIGDRAIRESLDALEFARRQNGSRDSRHHLAHLQLFDPQDVPRLRRLGVVANFQALWAYRDSYIEELTLPVLGPERSRWLYPIRSIAQSGAMLVGGSDWTVTSMNPLEAIQVAVTRRGPEEGPGPAWIPEETIDLATMLAAYTINGAYVNFEDRETGSIEVGKGADLVVLDRNLFEIPPHEIHRARVLLTLLEGKEVYRSGE